MSLAKLFKELRLLAGLEKPLRYSAKTYIMVLLTLGCAILILANPETERGLSFVKFGILPLIFIWSVSPASFLGRYIDNMLRKEPISYNLVPVSRASKFVYEFLTRIAFPYLMIWLTYLFFKLIASFNLDDALIPNMMGMVTVIFILALALNIIVFLSKKVWLGSGLSILLWMASFAALTFYNQEINMGMEDKIFSYIGGQSNQWYLYALVFIVVICVLWQRFKKKGNIV